MEPTCLVSEHVNERNRTGKVGFRATFLEFNRALFFTREGSMCDEDCCASLSCRRRGRHRPGHLSSQGEEALRTASLLSNLAPSR